MQKIELNNTVVAKVDKCDSGIYRIYLGINYYTDESLDRMVKYLSVYGNVVVSDVADHASLPDRNQMQDNLNAAAYQWTKPSTEPVVNNQAA